MSADWHGPKWSDDLPNLSPERFKELVDQGAIIPIPPGQRVELNLQSPRPEMIPSEQEAQLRNHLDAGWEWMRELLDDPARRRVVERSAIDRHRKGFETFGDSGWHKHADELMVEMIEELADFLVYAAMRSYRRRGGPGV